MSAAHKGQGGTGHFNEQPREYWISLMKEQGYFSDESLTKRLQTVWRWYPENLFAFRKSAHPSHKA